MRSVFAAPAPSVSPLSSSCRSNVRRAARRSRALRCACEPLERRRLLAAISWDGGGDGLHWDDAANWSSDQLPTINDDVTIATGSVRVDQADAAAKTLNVSAPLAVDHHTLTVDGNVTIGADTSLHASVLYINGDLTVNATLLVNLGYSSPATSVIFTGATDRSITGTGTINSLTDDQTSQILNDTHDGSGVGKRLTIGSGVVISGNDLLVHSTHVGGVIENHGDFTTSYWSLGYWGVTPPENGTVVNYGEMTVNWDTTAINLHNMPGGTIHVVGGTLTLQGDWHNDGTITLGPDANLNLDGDFEFADLGNFTRTGGTVNVVGTMQNTGHTFTLDNVTGPWNFYGTLVGGTYQGTGDNLLYIYGGRFTGVTVNSPLHILGAELHVNDGITINSTVSLEYGVSSSPNIQFDGELDQSINGTGSIVSMTGDSFSNLWNTAHTGADETAVGKQLTIGSGIHISGPNLGIHTTTLGGSIVNNGTLTASNWFLGDTNGPFVNNAPITADTFVQITNLQNHSTITATGAYFGLDGDNWDNNGSIALTDSDLYLGGSFDPSDIGNLSRSGTGDTHLNGTLNNASTTFTLDNIIRNLYFDGGMILGGTVAATGGHQLIGISGILENVTLNAPASVTDYERGLYLQNNVTLNSTITLNTGGSLVFYSSNVADTLGGTGSIVVAADIGSSAYLISYATSVTIGSGITLRGSSLLHVGGPIVNYGSISANVAGGTWDLGSETYLENHGTISASNGAYLQLNTLHNESGATVNVGSGSTMRIRGDNWSNDGVIDLNGSMIVDYDATDPQTAIQASINTARNGGNWLGAAGITSTSARLNPQHNTTLGVMPASDFKLLYGNDASFAGQAIDTTSVLVKYTYNGDANFDGRITFDDYTRIDTGFNQHRTGWANGDFNGDGAVNFDDYVLIDTAFNTQGSTLIRLNPRSGARDATATASRTTIAR